MPLLDEYIMDTINLLEDLWVRFAIRLNDGTYETGGDPVLKKLAKKLFLAGIDFRLVRWEREELEREINTKLLFFHDSSD